MRFKIDVYVKIPIGKSRYFVNQKVNSWSNRLKDILEEETDMPVETSCQYVEFNPIDEALRRVEADK